MRIGEVAEKAGVNVQTLRYYERRGLLSPPPRTPGGYRIYPLETVKRVRFIQRIQELGFSLVDVEELFSLKDATASTSARRIASEKRASVRARMDHLKAMDAALTHLIAGGADGSALSTLLIEALVVAD